MKLLFGQFKKSNTSSKSNYLAKNIFSVVFSNVIGLLSSIFIGFLIPKIMGELNYGFYKTFSLYSGYVGILHFGFADGIFLLYSGLNYNDLDKTKFRAFTRFFFSFQAVVALLICFISCLFITEDIGFILLFTGIYLFFANITTYYQFVSQATERFKELSIRNVLQAIFRFTSVLVLFILYKLRIFDLLYYKIYILVYVAITIFLAIWYFITYRDITIGPASSFKCVKTDIFSIFKVGIPLLIANISSNLILSIDRQFVNVLVGIGKYTMSEFGIYCFAYNMISIISTIISAVAVVIFPFLKRIDQTKMNTYYKKSLFIILSVSSLCLLFYLPLCFVVKSFLPNYVTSLPVFKAIIPSVILSCSITVVTYNFYKAINVIKLFFIQTISVLLLSLASNFIAYFFFGTMISISYASVFVLLLWFLISNIIIAVKLRVSVWKDLLFTSLVCLFFYCFYLLISNEIIATCLYSLVLVVLLYTFYKSSIIDVYRTISNSIEKNYPSLYKKLCSLFNNRFDFLISILLFAILISFVYFENEITFFITLICFFFCFALKRIDLRPIFVFCICNIVLIGICSISTVFYHQFDFIASIRDFYYYCQALFYVLFGYYIYKMIDLSKIKNIFILSSCIICLINIIRFFFFRPDGNLFVQTRLIFLDGVDVVVVASMMLFADFFKKTAIKEKIIKIVIFVILFACFVFCMTRVYLTLIVPYFILLIYKNTKPARFMIILSVFIVSILVLAFSLYSMGVQFAVTFIDKLMNSLKELNPNREWDYYNRSQYWRGYEVHALLSDFSSFSFYEKLFGRGFGYSSQIYPQILNGSVYFSLPFSHNAYCGLLIKSGIIGTELSIVSFFDLLYCVKNTKGNKNNMIVCLFYSFLIYFLLGAFVDQGVYIPAMAVCLISFGIAFSHLSEEKKDEKNNCCEDKHTEYTL